MIPRKEKLRKEKKRPVSKVERLAHVQKRQIWQLPYFSSSNYGRIGRDLEI